jgi:hypothetical protein
VSDLLGFAGSMVLTHLPYWLVAAYIVFAARRTRRALEAMARELEEHTSRRS